MVVGKCARNIVASLAIAISTVGIGLPPALAHDVVIRSTPGDKSTIEQPPTELELEFSGIPKDTFNTVALSNDDTGEVLFSASPELENQTIRVQIPRDVTLNPGNYKVGFQITSSDGHATRGMTTFRLAGDAVSNTSKTVDVAEPAAESSSSQSTLLYLGGGLAVAIVAVVGVVLVLSRRKS